MLSAALYRQSLLTWRRRLPSHLSLVSATPSQTGPSLATAASVACRRYPNEMPIRMAHGTPTTMAPPIAKDASLDGPPESKRITRPHFLGDSEESATTQFESTNLWDNKDHQALLIPSKPVPPSLIHTIRAELYRYPLISDVAPTERRQYRRHLWYLYQLLSRDPQTLQQLSREDVRALVHVYGSLPGTKRTSPYLGRALQVLEEVVHAGFEMGAEEKDLMVEVLRKLRRWDAVRQAVCEMKDTDFVPSAASYAAAIEAEILLGNIKRAEEWLEEMKEEGRKVGEEVYAIMMEGYLWKKDIGALVGVCEKMVQEGMILEVEIDNSDMDRRSKEGSQKIGDLTGASSETRRLVDRSLNHLISYFIELNKIPRARDIYTHKRNLGLPLNTALRRLVEACYRLSEMDVLETLLTMAITEGDQRGGQIISAAILDHHIAREDLQKAVALYDRLRDKTDDISPMLASHSYISLLHALADNNIAADTMKVYRDLRTIYPSEHLTINTYNRVLSGLVRGKAYLDARHVHRDLLTNPFIQPDVHTYNALVHLCGQTGSKLLAERVVSEMVARDIPLSHGAYTSLMACHVQANDPNGATRVFGAMITAGFWPDVTDFNVLIRAHGEPVVKIVPILQKMREVGIEPNASTYRTLHQAYLRAGMRSEANEVLKASAAAATAAATAADKGMTRWNVGLDTRTLNMLLTRQIRERGIKKVVSDFFEHEIRDRDQGASWNPPRVQDWMTYKILLDATVPNYMAMALRIKRQMIKEGHKPGKRMYVKMVAGWAKKREFGKARREIAEMQELLGLSMDVQVFTALLDGYLANGMLKKAREVVLKEMVEERGIEPDEELMEKLVRRHMEAGDIDGLGDLVKGLEDSREPR